MRRFEGLGIHPNKPEIAMDTVLMMPNHQNVHLDACADKAILLLIDTTEKAVSYPFVKK